MNSRKTDRRKGVQKMQVVSIAESEDSEKNKNPKKLQIEDVSSVSEFVKRINF